MLGYWHDDEKTAEAIDADGWMHTGDLAVMRDDGYCNVVGRIKDMVIRGGENVYPREIEEFLYTHPDIEDAQVIGVPDDEVRRGDLRLDPDEAGPARAGCRRGADVRRRASLAHYKIPRYVHVVDEFPMTVTGKVRKVEMRQESVESSGSKSPLSVQQPGAVSCCYAAEPRMSDGCDRSRRCDDRPIQPPTSERSRPRIARRPSSRRCDA